MDSSTVESSSPLNVPFLCQLLEGEKEGARRWLRTEMDILVHPLIDRLFNKLKIKLTTTQEWIQSGDQSGDRLPVRNMYQQEYPGHLNSQKISCPAITDYQFHNPESLSAWQLPNGHVNPNGIEYEHQSLMFGETTYEQITTNQPQNPPSQSFTPNIEQSNQNDAEYCLDGGDDNQQQNDKPNDINIEGTGWMDSDQADVKEEFDDKNCELITTDQMSQSTSSSFSAPASNDQSNHNFINCDDDEGDCECEDCHNGIEVKDEYDDVQIIEDSEDESDEPSRPRKIARLDTTEPKHEQPLVSRQSSILTNRNQTDQTQSNNEQQIEDQADETNEVEPNQDKQFLTLSVHAMSPN